MRGISLSNLTLNLAVPIFGVDREIFRHNVRVGRQALMQYVLCVYCCVCVRACVCVRECVCVYDGFLL